MKVSTIIAHVSAVALAVLQAATAHAAAGERAVRVVLNVNDSDAIGAVGDARLSLDEAVRLANGTLAIGGLSAAERAQIAGAPGAHSRDLIALPKGATLTVPKGAAMSPLVGNDGDIVDGNGAMLAAGADGEGTGFTLSSSNFTLRNVQGRGFGTVVNVEFGGRALTNIVLEKLHLLGVSPQSALLAIGAMASNGSLDGLSVADSVFDTGGKVEGSLVFIAAARTPPGATVDNVRLENLRVVRNRFHGGRLGLYVTGSLGAGRTTNAVTRNVVVADNLFTGQHDAAANLVGALPAVGGRHTKVGLENVVATGNRMEAANWGFYMGNEMFGANQPGEMTDGFLRNVTVSKNRIVRGSGGSIGQCIALENAADYRGDRISNNLIENIRITDNDISGCVSRTGDFREPNGAGVTVHGGKGPISGPGSGGGIARNNVIRNIEISNNLIKDSTRGIAVIGGFAFEPGTAEGPTVITGNSVTDVRILSNRLENNPTGIWVAGGEAAIAGATVGGNSVNKVRIEGNRIAGSKISCRTIADAGGAAGNSVNAACQAPLR